MEGMEAYTDFAEVYDTFMDDTPYEEWADFIAGLIEKYGISKPVRNADCEKDIMKKGYDMMGIDNSEEMLRIAMEKKEKSGSEILYLCQDMRDLDLYSTVGTVISVCDSINYLLEDEDVEDTFSLVNNYLYPGGLFIFDFNTVYKYETVIGDDTIAENRDNCSFIWENYYHPEEHINEYDLTIFAKEEKEELFRRFSETHFQRGYTLPEMEQFVKGAGMEILLTLDADTHEAPREESERIYIVAGRKKD